MPTIDKNWSDADPDDLAEGVSQGIAEKYAFRSDAPDDLTDIDGIGPSTAEHLRRADIERPEELRGKSTQTLSAIEGIGPKRAERIRSQVEYEDFSGRVPGEGQSYPSTIRKPFDDRGSTTVHRRNKSVGVKELSETTQEKQQELDDFHTRSLSMGAKKGPLSPSPRNVSVAGPDKEEALDHMADRSHDERRSDRSYNAPITLDVDVWKRNDDRLDYPGVDTVPKSRRLKRTENKVETAFRKGGLSRVKTKEADSDRFGYHRASSNEISVDTGIASDPEGTLAHELGHAVDNTISDDDTTGYAAENSGIFDDEETREQAKKLAERRRGRPIERIEESYESKDYPFDRELFADVYAEATEEPRAAKREAPKAVRKVEELTGGSGFLPGSPL